MRCARLTTLWVLSSPLPPPSACARAPLPSYVDGCRRHLHEVLPPLVSVGLLLPRAAQRGGVGGKGNGTVLCTCHSPCPSTTLSLQVSSHGRTRTSGEFVWPLGTHKTHTHLSLGLGPLAFTFCVAVFLLRLLSADGDERGKRHQTTLLRRRAGPEVWMVGSCCTGSYRERRHPDFRWQSRDFGCRFPTAEVLVQGAYRLARHVI